MIPDSVQLIRSGAFSGCSSLPSITIPDSVELIDTWTFDGCRSLTSISIPSSVNYIGERAFEACDALKKVVLHGTPRIDSDAFYCSPVQIVEASEECKKKNYAAFECLKEYRPQKPTESEKGGCYVATAVYGAYDCPEVWTLRRFRDDTLDRTWYGRAFIRAYYAVSPALVRWFGTTSWFRSLFKTPLDRLVRKLRRRGVQDTPYQDKY